MVQFRLINVASGASAMAQGIQRQRRAAFRSTRAALYAHTIADELHKEQRG